MVTQSESYPARLDIDYPEKLDRFSTFFRLIWAIPILIIAGLLSATSSVVGVARWGLRIQAYAYLLVTDRYPPFSLQ